MLKTNIDNGLPDYGVGIIYSEELHQLCMMPEVDFIEIEPQTLWMKENEVYRLPIEIKETLDQIPKKKLIHSVGIPVGGSFNGEHAQIELLKKNIEIFKPSWISEHLAFNRTSEYFTGFFLPPLQSEAGITQATENVRRIKQELKIPFAVETGVNYLRPRKGEIEDGKFLSDIIIGSDCGLLLDLHNLYTNQLNGRQSVMDFFAQIPLDRVWEIHLAGGFEMDGYYLDAHSGKIPGDLIAIANEIVTHLPNLKAITYEILPAYLQEFGYAQILGELDKIKLIWSERGKSITMKKQIDQGLSISSKQISCEVKDWEDLLGKSVLGLVNAPAQTSFLDDDPGVSILRKLVKEFRASTLVSTLKLSYRLLSLYLGHEVVWTVFEDFWSKVPPSQFASDEAINFVDYLRESGLEIPNLKELLQFEEYTIKTLIDGKNRSVHFDYDPVPLIKSLLDYKLETMDRQKGNYILEITG